MPGNRGMWFAKSRYMFGGKWNLPTVHWMFYLNICHYYQNQNIDCRSHWSYDICNNIKFEIAKTLHIACFHFNAYYNHCGAGFKELKLLSRRYFGSVPRQYTPIGAAVFQRMRLMHAFDRMLRLCSPQTWVTHYNDVIMGGAIASQLTSLTIVYSTVYFSDADERKHQSFSLLAFVRGIHRWPVNSPHKGPVTRKMFPFDDVIMTAAHLWMYCMSHGMNVCEYINDWWHSYMIHTPWISCNISEYILNRVNSGSLWHVLRYQLCANLSEATKDSVMYTPLLTNLEQHYLLSTPKFITMTS